jgi:hypothetical protein
MIFDRIFRLINDAQEEPDPTKRAIKMGELRKLEQKLRRGKG